MTVRLISWHTGRYLLMSILFLTTTLVTGVWLTQSLRFIEIIVNQNISLGGYFSLVSYLIPDLMVIVLPICTLIATIFTYNKLIADSEMAIFRSCGLSNLQIAKPAFVLTLGLMFVSFFVNIYVVPSSFRHFRDLEYKIRTEISANIIREGAFNTLRNTTIYVKKRGKADDLYGVFIHYHPSAKSPKSVGYSITADHGFLTTIDDKLHLILYKGIRQEKNPETGRVTFFHFAQLTYDLTSTLTDVEARIIKPYERPLEDLLFPEDTLPLKMAAKMRAEGHQRLMSPLLVLLFGMIACAVMLTGHYNRHGRRQRILGAIGAAGLCQILVVSLINMNERSIAMIWLAYGVVVMAMIVCAIMLISPHQIWRQWFKAKGENSHA